MKRSKLLLGTLMCTLFFGFIFLISCKDKDDPQPAGPSAPELTSPADEAVDQPLTPTLTWEEAEAESGVEEYALYFGTTADPSTLIFTGANTSVTFSTPLENSTTYYWKVQVTDTKDRVATSEIFSFTTEGVGEISISSVEMSSNTLSTSSSTDQADRSGNIVVTFSSSVENTFVAGSYTLLAGASSVPSTFTSSGSIVTITPSSTLGALTDYTVTLLSANPVGDNGGSLDADEAYDFKTAFFTGGDGSESYPYEIDEAVELDSIRRHLVSYFKLTDNVDLSSYLTNDGWVPINDFIGNIDGDFNEIQNLWITSGLDYVGLFGENTGRVDADNAGGEIHDLGLTIHSNGILGGQYVGGFIAELQGIIVSRCYVIGSGTVATNIAGTASRLGGFAGYITSGSILESFSTVNVGGTSVTGSQIADRLGGFVGGIGQNFGGISDSYSTGSVSGDADTGGFFGWASGTADKGLIQGVYSSGDVTTTDGTTSGIFAGNDFDTIGSGYYDTNASLTGGNAGISITNLTGVDFTTNGTNSASFPGLSTSTWAFGPSGISGSNGPVLQWEVGD